MLIIRYILLKVASTSNPLWETIVQIHSVYANNSSIDAKIQVNGSDTTLVVPFERKLAVPLGVRLFAPKVSAIPGKLSTGEYLALAAPMTHFLAVFDASSAAKIPNPEGSVKPTILDFASFVLECQIQSELFPELLDYTGKE